MNILIVDDEKMVLQDVERSVRKALSKLEWDANIYTTRNMVEAMEMAETITFDIAFLDVIIPGISGLDLGYKLKDYNAHINLIYVTAYKDYAVDANALHISGYLLKPVDVDSIVEELKHLRYPVSGKEEHHLRVQCFGNFEVFYENQPVVFRRQKTKELLAFLIDKNGAAVTANEICAGIFEDTTSDVSHKNTLRVLSMELKRIFERYGLSDAYIHTRNAYSVRPELISCDYYEYLKGNRTLYHGKFMEQYSYWAFFDESMY